MIEPGTPNARVADRLRDITAKTPLYASLFRRVYTAPKLSRLAAVKAKCLDCCCWQRKEVELCTSVTCPLWRIRPFQGKARLGARTHENRVLQQT